MRWPMLHVRSVCLLCSLSYFFLWIFPRTTNAICIQCMFVYICSCFRVYLYKYVCCVLGRSFNRLFNSCSSPLNSTSQHPNPTQIQTYSAHLVFYFLSLEPLHNFLGVICIFFYFLCICLS